MLLVIDNYDSFTYNLVHYAQELGADAKVVRNLSVAEALAMGAKGILLSPGPCTPNEAGICLDLITNAPDDLPILGICLGQQSIGQAKSFAPKKSCMARSRLSITTGRDFSKDWTARLMRRAITRSP